MLMKKEVIDENKRLKRMLDDKFMKENPLLVENGIICLKNKELKEKEQEIKDLKKELTEEKQAYINMYNMYDEEKKKNERAIEYIENNDLFDSRLEETALGEKYFYYYDEEKKKELLEILKGEDKE